jgi:hypothetical protein
MARKINEELEICGGALHPDEPCEKHSRTIYALADSLLEVMHVKEIQAACDGVEYREHGKHDTWDQYHEGRSDFADTIDRIMNEDS